MTFFQKQKPSVSGKLTRKFTFNRPKNATISNIKESRTCFTTTFTFPHPQPSFDTIKLVQGNNFALEVVQSVQIESCKEITFKERLKHPADDGLHNHFLHNLWGF